MISVPQVVQQLVQNCLLTYQAAEASLSQWRTATGATDDAAGDKFLAWLVKEEVLTDFQAEAFQAGHTGTLTLGPYRVLRRMAVGRLGSIYRAIHQPTGQAVSLKVFPSKLKENAEDLARMKREIRASSELDHPNLVRTYHVGQEGDVYYLAFEELRGETLQDRLDREGALPCATACRMVRDAALGLGCLHDHFLIHRDVCPANLWITDNGVSKVMELGAARYALTVLGTGEDATVTTGHMVLGTYEYMAPEQAHAAHAADIRSDVYALGCTFYRCLAGHPPFKEKNPLKLAMRHATETPRPLGELVADIPADLAETVATMLAKAPDARLQSMADVAHSLDPYADEPSVVAEKEESFAAFMVSLREPAPDAGDSPSSQSAGFLLWLADGFGTSR